MSVGSRGLASHIPPNTGLLVDGVTIIPGSSLKNLRTWVYVDSHMIFDSHINNISRQIFNTLLFINRIRENFNKNSRITVIQSLVLSVINYGLMVWGTNNTTTMNRIQKLQNFAAKVALGGASKHEHATPFLRVSMVKDEAKVYV